MKTLTIIDTFGFFFRNYYALPYLKSKDGFPTGLLTGFINFIASLDGEYSTDYLLFALDSKTKSIRKEIYPNYKANRPTPPEDLQKQLPVAIEWIKKMGFEQLEIDGYEADDIIGFMVKCAKEQNIKVRIVTHDKDLYQLIDDDIVVIYDPVKKVEINEAKCKEKFGVEPKQIVDYLAIVGDASDNIPGVKGIGAKGAVKLLEEFGSLENIYKNIDHIKNSRVKNLLLESKENAFLSKKLALLHNDLMQSCQIDKFAFPDKNPILNIKDELAKYDIKAVLKRVSPKSIKKSLEFKATLLNDKKRLFEVIDSISLNSIVAFDTETDSLNAREANIVGFSFAINEQEAFYVPIAHRYLGIPQQITKDDAKIALKKLIQCKIVGQNLKYDLAILKHNFNLHDVNIHADTMIISWLLDPSLSASLDNLAKRYFSYEMIKFKDIVKKGENFSHIQLTEACQYAAEDAWMSLKLYNFLYDKLDNELLEVAKKVEFVFIKTLLNMEEAGIKIDIDFFKKLKTKTDKKIANLTDEIYKLSGSEFNINSTQQLGIILFEKLKLKATKKTKTGYSTNEEVLKSLINEHEIIPKLLNYREIYKLKSTYIEPLLKLALKDKDHRIHTSFLQTGTSTGRLSSKNPNLQNIPVKTQLGKEVREGFIAKDGYKLIGIDYSQIELRLLAHFSKDPHLIKAFKEDKDIHLETAIKLFGEKRAKEKRSVAKSINFGLLYGMGSRKLAQTLNVSQKEAKEYIENYFKSFPTVKRYIKETQEFARKYGYVKTILNRKRVFDYENANAMQIASYDRECVNTIFQGSAADIIKLAMNKFEEIMDKDISKMLLQIHDELIFEVKKEYAKDFANEAKDIMENIYSLEVPLKTTLSIGDNWGELK